MSGDPPNAPVCPPDRAAELRANVVEALKNADENGYGPELRKLPNTEIAVDLINYCADLEDVEGLELLIMLQVIDEWKKK